MKKPTAPSKRKGNYGASSDDDVRSSLNFLDSVIGEFDDGLVSAAESDYNQQQNGGGGSSSSNGGLLGGKVQEIDDRTIAPEIRKRPPPKIKDLSQRNPQSSGISLTDKIDDIFSELTEEIYSVDKQQKIINNNNKQQQHRRHVDDTQISHHSNNSSGRQLSPIRRVNDPLPTPPIESHSRKIESPGSSSKDEVVVYGEKERPKEVIPLKKSVKAQVHSLETRGRGPPVKKNQHAAAVQQQNFSKNVSVSNSRSRSENPPQSKGSKGQRTKTSSKTNGNDDFASRVNPKGQKSAPPPMPEKTKIHLKNDSSLGHQPKQKGSKSRNRLQDQPLPALPSTEPNSMQSSSHPYEALIPDLPTKKESNDSKYKRSKSVGPVVEAAQKELLAAAIAARERSRSRGPATQERPITDSGGRGGAQPRPSKSSREGNNSLESSSRGRSRTKLERSASNKMKVDVMDPFIGGVGGHHHPGGAGGVPPLGGGLPHHAGLHPSRGMPARQKSMIDLRDPSWDHPPPPKHLLQHHHQNHGRQGTPPGGGGRHFGFGAPQNLQPHHPGGPPQQQQPPNHRPPMMRSATEHDIKVRNRRSMAVGPFEELPPHIRQHMIRQHGIRLAEDGGFLVGNNSRQNPNSSRPMNSRDRQMVEEDAMLMRHLTLESQREFLMRRGFSPSHPYISGEVPIHPELQGRLPFNVPSRTIPLRPDDYQRFKPEYWLQNHNNPPPNQVAFTDLAVLQSELELRRRRELHRQNSHRMHADGQENNFNSLPWEEIIPRRISGVPVMPSAEHELRANNNSNNQNSKSNKNRSKSQDPRKGRLFGGGGSAGGTGNGSHSGSGGASGGSGWFNPGQVWKETRENDRNHQESTRGSGSGASGGTGNVKQNGHWLLRERETNLAISMPPNIDTLRDSGIGLSSTSSPQKPDQENNLPTNLSRNEPKRSSFGMALKDKFNKNPNMYFPGPVDSQSGHGSGHGSSKSSSAGKKSSSGSLGGTGSPTKTNTDADLSDTDTLIHNMSDGSFEKDESLNDDHDSFGSAKGSRSSGNSSLSPHNSMEGSPRMISTPQFQPVPSANPSVSLGKKTIRNYTPKESSNMLREFEDRRNNSVDWRGQNSKHQKSGGANKTKPSIERKSSMDRLIDDFHRSLPAPPHHESNSTIATKRHGTMTSQISNWSAASSAASFEFQTVNSKLQNSSGNNNGGSPSLPSVHEELDQPADEQPQGERIPPEGAPAASMSGVSPTNFVQRIEVKSASKTKQSNNRSPQNRSSNNLPKTVPNNSNSKSNGANSKPERRKSNAKTEEIPLPPPPPPPPAGEDDVPLLPPEAAATGSDEVDEFSNLRKLISENRIAGLNAPPPSWSPPSPPATDKRVGRSSVERSASSSRRSPSSAGTKPPAPSTPKGAKSTHSAERQPSRKNREAPKPPVQSTSSTNNRSNTSTPNSDVKFVSSRQRESLEDLTQMNSKKRSEVKRSSSNHGSRPSGFGNHFEDNNTAQLIADSTEKKFNFNPFKGKLFKKKQYSFDFN